MDDNDYIVDWKPLRVDGDTLFTLPDIVIDPKWAMPDAEYLDCIVIDKATGQRTVIKDYYLVHRWGGSAMTEATR